MVSARPRWNKSAHHIMSNMMARISALLAIPTAVPIFTSLSVRYVLRSYPTFHHAA